jgi:hydroxypyruvate isomerase
MPGYFAGTVERAAALVRSAESPSVRLQLDQYHVGMAGADARAALRRYASLVAHVQIADVPGRNQPGTGSQPIGELLGDLDQLKYSGSVGLEYRPRGTMDEALAWLPRADRA